MGTGAEAKEGRHGSRSEEGTGTEIAGARTARKRVARKRREEDDSLTTTPPNSSVPRRPAPPYVCGTSRHGPATGETPASGRSPSALYGSHRNSPTVTLVARAFLLPHHRVQESLYGLGGGTRVPGWRVTEGPGFDVPRQCREKVWTRVLWSSLGGASEGTRRQWIRGCGRDQGGSHSV